MKLLEALIETAERKRSILRSFFMFHCFNLYLLEAPVTLPFPLFDLYTVFIFAKGPV